MILATRSTLEVCRVHVGRKGPAISEYKRAGELMTEGRFNEAIVALRSGD